MNKQEFYHVAKHFEKAAMDLMTIKQEHYADDTDVLSNFREAADLNQTDMTHTIWGYATKHIVAIADNLNREEWDDRTCGAIMEHITDLHNYLVYMAILLSEY